MSETRPLLTNKQREVLLEFAAGDADVGDHSRDRSRLRSRIRSVIAEFPFLLAALPVEDRREIFTDLLEYQEWQDRKWDQPAVTIRADDLPDGAAPDRAEHVMRAAEEPDPLEEQGERLYDGIVAALGFLYAGVNDRPTFEHMLEGAIRESRLVDGKIAVDVDVSIEADREEDRDELVERLEAGELDDAETLGSLLKSDPSALFEAGLSGDEGE